MFTEKQWEEIRQAKQKEMSDTLIELKPCPFCGGAGELHPSALSAFTRMAFVECVDCGCRSMASHYDNPGFMPQHIVKAAENWNNRLDEKELAEARAEIERLALEIENRQYTITCASEENQQLKESLAEARAEIDAMVAEFQRLADEPPTLEEIAADLDKIEMLEKELAERDKLIEQLKKALESAKLQHYVNDDDNWYSCPASGLCGNDSAGTDCNCGADYVNSIIKAALSAAERINK